ncbi:hypothetical protein DFJ73DRAFT_798773 [Zopfochytrium polystomum]|nr:hypothetical protein DFJ73DRAFT_798773 [Zopfochytrium polystomum]
MDGEEVILAPPIDPIHRLAYSFAAVRSAYDNIESLKPTDETLIFLAERVTHADEEHQSLMSSSATATSQMIDHAEAIADYMELMCVGGVDVADIRAAFKLLVDDARQIVEVVTAVKGRFDELNRKVKQINEEYSTRATQLKIAELDWNEKAKIAAVKETFKVGFAIVMGVAAVAFGDIPLLAGIFGAGSAATAISSIQCKKEAESARQQASAASSNGSSASKASKSLEDIIQHLAMFVAFWTGHTDRVESRVAKLNFRNLAAFELQCKVKSRAWRAFSADLKQYHHIVMTEIAMNQA